MEGRKEMFSIMTRMNELMFNDTPARKTDRLLGVSKKVIMTHSALIQYSYMASNVW